ncbi:MAG: hypothetical protein ACRD3G_22940 [Vicinamibacterales bacterium]
MRQFAVALAFSVATMTAQEPARSGGPLRPLALPALGDGQSCPIATGTKAVPPSPRIFGGPFWWGTGPAYVGLLWTSGDQGRFSLAPIPIENGMRRAKTAFVADPSYSGVIEVRGGSLRRDRRPLIFGQGGAPDGELMRLTAPHVLDAGWVDGTGVRQPNLPALTGREWSFWPASTWIPGPGCYGIQLDTPQRSSLVVFEAL